jgi:hypothetical protein
MPSSDPFRTREKLSDPAGAHARRRQCYGKSLSDDRLNFSLLMYSQVRPGCSVVYYPPNATAQGTGIVSRYYDFTTGTMRGRPARSRRIAGHGPALRDRNAPGQELRLRGALRL